MIMIVTPTCQDLDALLAQEFQLDCKIHFFFKCEDKKMIVRNEALIIVSKL